MALSFSEKLRGTAMGKAYRLYEVTHDGAVVSINAKMLDLSYVEQADVYTITAVGAVADYDTLATSSGYSLALTTAQSTGAKCVLEAWGW
jgi:hypothetical protein